MIPCEYAIWKILPKIRKSLALEMKKQGLSQKRISEILRTSEAAVSNYANGKRGGEEMPHNLDEMVSISAKRLINGSEISAEICELCREFQKQGNAKFTC